MTPYHLRDTQSRILALCLAVIDPFASIIAGIWLALQLHPIATSWMKHHPLHYVGWAVVLYVGVVLLAANVMAPCSLLLRGFGMPKAIFRETKPRHIAFWSGSLLVVASHNSLAVDWLERQDPSPNLTGTAILAVIACAALLLGSYDFVRLAWRAAALFIARSMLQANNQSCWQKLTGQLTLCAGVAQGVFRERNLLSLRDIERFEHDAESR